MKQDQAILVVGGAGYIGSHTVRQLIAKGRKVVVLDNLVYGHREALVDDGVIFVEGDLGDRDVLDRVFAAHDIAAVMHFAAFAYVGESVTEPAKYYHNNLAAPLVLLDAMRDHGCRIFIFSSTCATYGNPEYVPIDEQHPQNPINPYGAGKLMLERVLADYSHAYGLKYAALRYFNASGCSLDGKIGEDHNPETHLIPLVLEAAAGVRPHITVFGTDYPTPDGSCIRDYIHVDDLARAHILAIDKLDAGADSFQCNLGTGIGHSVKELIAAAEQVTGKSIPVVYGERRPGDPPELVAAPAKAKELLGWEAEYKDLEMILKTAWAWSNGPRKGHF
ncbi:MAG: UDP-glucose 4-epimerase GalE [Verrucomicrobia bacterium]|nr:UDP-glucose 4-epimerase GalE [Verrucomicrobiota bacterium]MCH8514667.1 UDP-glucose 4-epimerase GalE [Kiritimatiellia bacterium]